MAPFNRLKRWEGALNACIRCGYCYEHCPIYKDTRWEVDSPRGKLVMLFGMLNGELEPTDYIAEKLFECFHCGRCEQACSSGVPTLQVFADARADLMEAGFEPVGTTSQTNQELCVRCLNCVRMCPHEARTFDEKIVVDRLKCQSCGSCLDICSACGITIGKGYGTNPDELTAAMSGFLASENAKVVVFGCSWSSYPGFQTAQLDGANADPEHRVFVTACAGRVRTQALLDALDLGAWGVLLNCCPEDDCDHGGSARARVRVEVLQDMLERVGIAPERLRITEVPKTDPKAFKASVEDYLGKLRELGPLQAGGLR